MHRILAVLVVSIAVLARSVPSGLAADGAQRVIEYRKDVLSVKLDKVPLTEVLAEIGKQSGAEVRGDVLQPRDLTLQLDKVPLKEALERLLGEQNFTLTYADDGALRAIQLKGGREAAPDKTKPKPGVKYTAHPGDEGETPPLWRAVYGVFEDRGTVKVDDGKLSKVVGGDAARWDVLANTAIGSQDPGVRREAVEAGVAAFESVPRPREVVRGGDVGCQRRGPRRVRAGDHLRSRRDLVRNIRINVPHRGFLSFLGVPRLCALPLIVDFCSLTTDNEMMKAQTNKLTHAG